MSWVGQDGRFQVLGAGGWVLGTGGWGEELHHAPPPFPRSFCVLPSACCLLSFPSPEPLVLFLQRLMAER